MKDEEASATALVVARNIALVAATPDLAHLVPPDAAAWTRRLIQVESPRGQSLLGRLERGWFRALCRLAERCMIPGLALHQALRKRHIERIVRAALTKGYGQVVVLCAGFDTLALRLHREFPDVNFLEFDHPATQRIKRKVLEPEDAADSNLTLAPLDLTRRPLDEFLAERPEFQSNRASVVVCEGVLMYFSDAEVDGVFAALGRLNAPALRFVFTAMEPDRRGRASFRNSTWLVRLWLRLANEPFRWGIRREELGSFLRARNFDLIETASPPEFVGNEPVAIQRYRIAEGEFVCDSDFAPKSGNLEPRNARPSNSAEGNERAPFARGAGIDGDASPNRFQ